MPSTFVLHTTAESQFATLRAGLLFSDLGATETCKSSEQLAGFAWAPIDRLDNSLRSHLASCPRCASRYATLRSYQRLRSCPDKWIVPLQSADLTFPDNERELQLLGYLNLESKDFHVCEAEAEWNPTPTGIRVNVVIDKEADVFAVSLLDVPRLVKNVSIVTPDQVLPTVEVDDPRAFE
jgi:hypothetical protein